MCGCSPGQLVMLIKVDDCCVVSVECGPLGQ